MRFSLVIPAHNEEIDIKQSIETTILFLQNKFSDGDWEIVIAENGSTDETRGIVQDLEKKYTNLRLLIIPTAGKGWAVRQAWDTATAELLIFMDADLATDLKHLPDLIEALKDNDLVIGTRRYPSSQVSRSWQRSLTSFLYNRLARIILSLPFSDLQCGFKGIKKTAWQKISPYFTSTGFFFDTELLALANKFKLKTAEQPITWKEHRNKKNKSKVRLVKTGKELIKNLLSLKKRLTRLRPSL
ncbi:MAG: glycosyltransferase [Patescibacteria group bacterium]|jgi:hypothetical protein